MESDDTWDDERPEARVTNSALSRARPTPSPLAHHPDVEFAKHPPAPSDVNPFQWALLAGLITFFAVISFSQRWSVVAFAAAFIGIFSACLYQNHRAKIMRWRLQEEFKLTSRIMPTSSDD